MLLYFCMSKSVLVPKSVWLKNFCVSLVGLVSKGFTCTGHTPIDGSEIQVHPHSENQPVIWTWMSDLWTPSTGQSKAMVRPTGSKSIPSSVVWSDENKDWRSSLKPLKLCLLSLLLRGGATGFSMNTCGLGFQFMIFMLMIY